MGVDLQVPNALVKETRRASLKDKFWRKELHTNAIERDNRCLKPGRG